MVTFAHSRVRSCVHVCVPVDSLETFPPEVYSSVFRLADLLFRTHSFFSTQADDHVEPLGETSYGVSPFRFRFHRCAIHSFIHSCSTPPFCVPRSESHLARRRRPCCRQERRLLCLAGAFQEIHIDATRFVQA